jgi:hypothetical protein
VSRATKVTVSLFDSCDREVEIRARYHGPTDDYFDRSFGNYLPGDPEEVEVLSARAVDEGANVAEVESDTEGIAEAVRCAASDDGPDEPDDWREARRA